jgi:hypothetical protein
MLRFEFTGLNDLQLAHRMRPGAMRPGQIALEAPGYEISRIVFNPAGLQGTVSPATTWTKNALFAEVPLAQAERQTAEQNIPPYIKDGCVPS